MYVFYCHVKILETEKFDQDPETRSGSAEIRIGLDLWIRIYIEVKSWIQIRIHTEANTDPQHWLPITNAFLCYNVQGLETKI